jgi:hypothetical protein
MFKTLQKPAIFGGHIASGDNGPLSHSYIPYSYGKKMLSALFLVSGRFVSLLPAAIHYFLIAIGFLKTPTSVCIGNARRFEILKSIWHARIVRRIISFLLLTSLRNYVFAFVNDQVSFPLNSGCVIAICHTPWKKLLVQWCLENDFALIVAHGQWVGEQRRIQKEAYGFSSLRQIVMHLRKKGKVFVTMDNFNDLDNCPVDFLGNNANAVMLPVRLAKMAHVPLEMIIPVLNSTSINFIRGPQFDLGRLKTGSPVITRELISFLENEIRNNPGIWEQFVK